MQLYQIPFSHNCIKVRAALEAKGVDCELVDVSPLDRSPVVAATGQGLVPALVDGDRRVADSTAILLHLEERFPEPPLLPADPRQRAECLVLEDWADAAFMALTRRIAYWQVLTQPGALEMLFFPDAGPLRRWIGVRVARRAVARRFRLSAERNRRDEAEIVRLAELAVARLGGRPHLVGDRRTLADVTLAAMAAPLAVAGEPVRTHPAVAELLEWTHGVLGEEVMALYRRPA